MPKLKTHKGTVKRIKRTSSGKLMRERAFTHHKFEKQSSARKRRLSIDSGVNSSNQAQIRRGLGIN
jgi:large subunit ribosomal protein L35